MQTIKVETFPYDAHILQHFTFHSSHIQINGAVGLRLYHFLAFDEWRMNLKKKTVFTESSRKRLSVQHLTGQITVYFFFFFGMRSFSILVCICLIRFVLRTCFSMLINMQQCVSFQIDCNAHRILLLFDYFFSIVWSAAFPESIFCDKCTQQNKPRTYKYIIIN